MRKACRLSMGIEGDEISRAGRSNGREEFASFNGGVEISVYITRLLVRAQKGSGGDLCKSRTAASLKGKG